MKKILIKLVLLVGACTNVQVEKQEPTPVKNIIEVSKAEYQLTNIFPGQGLTLGFDEQGRIFGYSGLNRFFGKAEIIDGNIKVLTLASTRMGGSREALIREDQYLKLLESMKTIQIDKGQLILSNEKGEKLIYIGE